MKNFTRILGSSNSFKIILIETLWNFTRVPWSSNFLIRKLIRISWRILIKPCKNFTRTRGHLFLENISDQNLFRISQEFQGHFLIGIFIRSFLKWSSKILVTIPGKFHKIIWLLKNSNQNRTHWNCTNRGPPVCRYFSCHQALDWCYKRF